MLIREDDICILYPAYRSLDFFFFQLWKYGHLGRDSKRYNYSKRVVPSDKLLTAHSVIIQRKENIISGKSFFNALGKTNRVPFISIALKAETYKYLDVT